MESIKNSNLEQHKKELNDLFSKFKAYCDSSDPAIVFSPHPPSHGTSISMCKDPKTGLMIVKGERSMKFPAETIINLLVYDDEASKKWDPSCDDIAFFSIEEEKYFYGYYKIKSVSIFDSRDFATVSTYYTEENNTYILTKSYKDEEIPEFKGCVRADLFLMGYGVFPINEKETMVKFVIHCDLKGNIPKFILNSMAADLAESLFNIEKYLEKNKAKEKAQLSDKASFFSKYKKK